MPNHRQIFRAFHSFQVSRVNTAFRGLTLDVWFLGDCGCYLLRSFLLSYFHLSVYYRHFLRNITACLPYFRAAIFFLEVVVVVFFHIITLDGLSKREATSSLWVRFLPRCTFVVDFDGTSGSLISSWLFAVSTNRGSTKVTRYTVKCIEKCDFFKDSHLHCINLTDNNFFRTHRYFPPLNSVYPLFLSHTQWKSRLEII